MGISGGYLDGAFWEAANILVFTVSDITTGTGALQLVSPSGESTGETRFRADDQGIAHGSVTAFGNCSNISGIVVFDGQTGNFPALRPPSCNQNDRIVQKWAALGAEGSFLAYPVNFETGTPDGIGRFNHFQGGSIYWTPQTDAHEAHGAIRNKWASLGWETSFLGYPLTDESGTPDGVGRFNHFQGGSIYWTPQTDAHEAHGAIRNKWASLGWETSFLGYPLTDESGTPDGVGRFNHFQGGSIYWTPQTDAHEAHGAIRDKWASLGWETSFLGYPVSDEQTAPDGIGRVSYFQHGNIYWSSQSGTIVNNQ